MSRSLKICAQVESGTIVAGYSAVAPVFSNDNLVAESDYMMNFNPVPDAQYNIDTLFH